MDLTGLVEEHTALLGAQLRARQEDLCAAVFARIRETVPDADRDGDPDRVVAMRSTIGAAIDFGVALIERAQPALDGLPAQAWENARLAAHNGGSLAVTLRGYVAGHLVTWEFIVEEAEQLPLCDAQRVALLRRASLIEATYFHRLVDLVSDEFMREPERATRGREQRRPQLIRELLDGREVADSDLGYGLAGHHIATIVSGANAEAFVQRLASNLDRQPLTLSRSERTMWAWLGGRRPLDPARVADAAAGISDNDLRIAIGEGGFGSGGFRATHRQAAAAYTVAQRTATRVTRYADVALLALALGSETPGADLPAVYLAALDEDPGRAAILRQTIRAYFAAGHNAASAAAALGIHKRTVSARLRTAEELLGHALNARRAELETALRVEELLGG